jgi:phosphopentomutase
MRDDDLLLITADHGCDPTYQGTDHTREYIPVLAYGKEINNNLDLGIRESFSDLAATIADIFEIDELKNGKSFKDEISK